MMLSAVGHFLTQCQVFPDCQDHKGGIQSLFKVEADSGLDHQFEGEDHLVEESGRTSRRYRSLAPPTMRPS